MIFCEYRFYLANRDPLVQMQIALFEGDHLDPEGKPALS